MGLPLVYPWGGPRPPARPSPGRVRHSAGRPSAYRLHTRLLPHHGHTRGMPVPVHRMLRHHPVLLVLLLLVVLLVVLVLVLVQMLLLVLLLLVLLVLLVLVLVGVPRAQGRELSVVCHHWGIQWLGNSPVRP